MDARVPSFTEKFPPLMMAVGGASRVKVSGEDEPSEVVPLYAVTVTV